MPYKDKATRKLTYRLYHKKYRQSVKKKVMDSYGGSCVCCGETHIEFLTIDHINGDGNIHRKELNISPGYKFYRWLINNKFPSGFRTLCMNCNFAKGHNNICPHETDLNKSTTAKATRLIGGKTCRITLTSTKF